MAVCHLPIDVRLQLSCCQVQCWCPGALVQYREWRRCAGHFPLGEVDRVVLLLPNRDLSVRRRFVGYDPFSENEWRLVNCETEEPHPSKTELYHPILRGRMA